MDLTEELKMVFIETAKVVKDAARRLSQARIVKLLGAGGKQCAEVELGWNRGTICKGLHELESGVTCLDAVSARGRKRAEERLSKLSTIPIMPQYWTASIGISGRHAPDSVDGLLQNHWPPSTGLRILSLFYRLPPASSTINVSSARSSGIRPVLAASSIASRR
jgi:hypothetical protein